MRYKINLELGAPAEPYAETIVDTVSDMVARVAEKIDISAVESVTIREDASRVIPQTGACGFAQDATTLELYIDSRSEHFASTLAEHLARVTAHELHHCARMRTIDYERNLLEAIIAEGLADHFDIEMSGGQPYPWSKAFADHELKELKDRALGHFFVPGVTNAWLFGSESHGIPQWAGYSLGFDLVWRYMRATGKGASELVMCPSERFLETR